MTPEGRVKAQVKKLLDARKPLLWYYMPVPLYNRGIPDIVGVYRGVLFAIETKAGNNQPTAIQRHVMREMAFAGAKVLVVNEKNVEAVAQMLDEICAGVGA